MAAEPDRLKQVSLARCSALLLGLQRLAPALQAERLLREKLQAMLLNGCQRWADYAVLQAAATCLASLGSELSSELWLFPLCNRLGQALLARHGLAVLVLPVPRSWVGHTRAAREVRLARAACEPSTWLLFLPDQPAVAVEKRGSMCFAVANADQVSASLEDAVVWVQSQPRGFFTQTSNSGLWPA
jgi:hypothetical protein